MCKILGDSRAGYYKYLKNQDKKQPVKQEVFLEKIKTIHTDSKGRYGSSMVHR